MSDKNLNQPLATIADVKATNTWSLYMIRTLSGALYTGITTDVARRFQQHQTNQGAKYLRGKGPLQLAFQYHIGTKSDALRLEYRVKRLTKQQKETLIQHPSTLATLFHYR